MPRPSSRRRVLAGTATACTALACGSVPERLGAAHRHDPYPPREGGRRRAQRTTRTADPDGLEAFVDGVVARSFDEHGPDGAAVSVVHDGEVALSKGYGHEYLDPDTPVDPGRSNFRVGSISKVFTWTAAMQLVDRGAVDPHAPAREYLDAVTVPDGEAPVSLAHLATHTPGFVQRTAGNVATDLDGLRPLAETLEAYPPHRFAPPGEVPSYTNYVAALAGQLVADVAGTTFESYVADELFDPLGMDHSTAGQAPDALYPETAAAAADREDWYSNVPPASGVTSTATGMAAFALAHLGGGDRILSSEATAAMHRRWFTPDEALAGMTFGMPAFRRGGTRILRHAGGTRRFASDFLLVPRLGLGVFVSYHGQTLGAAGRAKTDFVDAFLDRYVPVDDADAPTPREGRPTRGDELEGTYRSVQAAENPTYEKLPIALLGSRQVEVRVDGDALRTGSGDDADRWVEVEPLVFRREGGSGTLAFLESGGSVTHLVEAGAPHTALERVPRRGHLDAHGALAAAGGLAALSGAVAWPAGAAWRRLRRLRGGGAGDGGVGDRTGASVDGREGTDGDGPPRTADSPSAPPRLARWTAGSIPVLLAAFVLALGHVVASSGLWRPPSWLPAAFVLPVLAAVATGVTCVYAVRSWREGYWSLPARIHYTLVAAGAVVLCGLLRYWNLLLGPLAP
ncbi:serine hydrolase domain-containing protein [Halobium salinum]|uniref:Serine hydrolase domain-containing protein n=1 Tax=Halobium salinum TaxID=1364940 RepID=A0ABD5PD76_9EURY|nr:serine hydrolase domain-containing protein [Halobium salinum]